MAEKKTDQEKRGRAGTEKPKDPEVRKVWIRWATIAYLTIMVWYGSVLGPAGESGYGVRDLVHNISGRLSQLWKAQPPTSPDGDK